MIVPAVLSVCLLLGLSKATSLPTRRSDDPLKLVQLEAPDGSAKAHFIPYGAITTNFWVKDKQGNFRDIILGYDNHTNYLTDALGHPYFGPVVGRYANRIKNSTFTIGNNTYNISANENNGLDTLHGGEDGFDRRLWTIEEATNSSVTFSLTDPDGMEGFPGTVNTNITYTLDKNATWKIKMHATATEQTPIMLSCHHYWNFEAYQETQTLDDHFAQFPSHQVIGTDGILIPDGSLVNATGTPLDFNTAKSIGAAINQTIGLDYCGTGCDGFDNCWIYDNNTSDSPVFSLWSVNSGIRLDVTTNQAALQMYTCDGIYNASLPIPRKVEQGGPSAFYQDHSCVVVEQESWIDGINQPEWGVDQIYGPDRDYLWEAEYAFSVLQ